MSFTGSSFTFNNISSERFGLKITTPETKSTINVSNYKSNLIKIPRRSKFYATKRIVDEPLVLNISIFSETPLTRNQIDRIEDWLFGEDDEFKKLRINQDDLNGYYYNCRLQKLESETFGNVPYIVHCLLECDSHYIWQNPQTRIINITSTPTNFKFVNISSEDSLKPTYIVKVGMVYGLLGETTLSNRYIKITDKTTNEYMEFNGLLDNEIITIDTEHEIITSNMRTSGLLDLFNKNFMKLQKGKHEFIIEGDIVEFKITYQNARKFGN
ncbi:MAG TPA: hypothetical protein DD434_09695 [Bacteroidales bacterium]|nr:hypothetical protein [Bacteroidales bacterium]